MTRTRGRLYLTVVTWIAAGTLFILAGAGPDLRPAMAETVVFATGWEEGQPQGLINQLAYSREVAGYFNTFNPPPECGPRFREKPRSGDHSLMLAGYSRTGYAYAYFRVFDQNIPVVDGTRIGYWIYHQEGTPKISVDGHFTDGTTMRDVGGGALKDQHGVPIHPAARKDPMSQWYYVEVDLTPAAGKTLDFIMFAFDNGGDGFTGPFRAYVDNLQVVEETANACIASVSADHWQGMYFNNMQLAGDPVIVRDDGAGFLDFDWGGGSPDSECEVPADYFSVRWTRDVAFDAGTYHFTITSDDGFRLYIDDALKLERWINQAPTTYTVDVNLTAGIHTLELEYYENGGGAVAKLSWEESATDGSWAYPVGDAATGAGWQVTNPLGNSWYSSQNRRWYRGHLGEDWAKSGGSSLGEPVYAAADGRVVTLLNNCGNYVDVVIIEHQVAGQPEPVYSFYGHLEADGYVSEGDRVARRQQIGVLGDPVSFFPHLHFEIKNRTALINPPFSSCADTSNGIYIGAGYSGLSNDYDGGDAYDPTDGIAGNYYFHPTRFIENRKAGSSETDCSEFVADLNFPDGTEVSPGETIRKGWRLDNCGDTSWSAAGGYRAVRTGGSFGPAFVDIPSGGPGTTVDLYADITVPAAAGTYRATYRLEGPRGEFGTEFWVQIVVEEPADPCLDTVAADRWMGEYFNNKTLSGSPIMVREDGYGFLDFDWAGGSPSPDCGIGVDGYSARWTRDIDFSGGTYRFTVTADDGLRLYIDGDLKLARWFDQAPTTYTVDVPLSAGSHTVQLEFYENGGGAVAGLSWKPVASATSDLYGLGINANYADQNPPAWEIAELGARWLRSIRYRQDFAPNHGDVRWLVVFNSESIPRGGSESWPAYVSRFAQEIKNIVARNPWIEAVEIWNEQDLPDGDHGPGYGRYMNPADYASLLKTAYQTIKTLPHPPSVVVGGFGAGAGVGSQYLDEMKRQWGSNVYFDAVGFHPYLAVAGGIGWPERDTMENSINLLYAHAMGKPLWLTEFGAAIQHLGSKDIIAQYLENCYRIFEQLKDGNRRKVEVAFWFAWDDRTHWDPGRESHGLVEMNRSGDPDSWRRPAWYRYRDLSRR